MFSNRFLGILPYIVFPNFCLGRKSLRKNSQAWSFAMPTLPCEPRYRRSLVIWRYTVRLLPKRTSISPYFPSGYNYEGRAAGIMFEISIWLQRTLRIFVSLGYSRYHSTGSKTLHWRKEGRFLMTMFPPTTGDEIWIFGRNWVWESSKEEIIGVLILIIIRTGILGS